MNRTDILNEARTYVQKMLHDRLDPKVHYHDWGHTQFVYDNAEKLSELEGIDEHNRFLLLLAVIFHDSGFVIQSDDHETHSKEIADKFLQEKVIAIEDRQKILAIIESTRMTSPANTAIEAIMCDADLANLGDESFFQKGKKLRQEWSELNNKKYDEKAWLKNNIAFLKSHEYKTPSGNKTYSDQKEKNLSQLQQHLKEMSKESKKVKSKKHKTDEQGAEAKYEPFFDMKGAQVMIKTTMRNQIDLTSIADNKANIMLTVNALILSIALPEFTSQVSENKLILIPMILLTLTCLSSMFYATLVTRPIAMKGDSEIKGDARKNLNLFFFGNFYKMNFPKFKEGMISIFDEEEVLDNAVLMDLFYLGKSLGKKYARLRITYTIFIAGIALSFLAFLLVLIFSLGSN